MSKRYRMRLSAVGNPDHGQTDSPAAVEIAHGDTLKELQKKVEDYIDHYSLGGGNWTNPLVMEGRKLIGHFSYNGRLWEGNGVDVTNRKEIQIEG